MTAIILFAIFLLVFGLVVGCCGDRAEAMRVRVACECGVTVADQVIVVDSLDAQRAGHALTENCPFCREMRRRRNQVIGTQGSLSAVNPHAVREET